MHDWLEMAIQEMFQTSLEEWIQLQYSHVLLSSTDSKSDKVNDKTRQKFPSCFWSKMFISFLIFTEKKGKIKQYKFIGVLATTTIIPMTS